MVRLWKTRDRIKLRRPSIGHGLGPASEYSSAKIFEVPIGSKQYGKWCNWRLLRPIRVLRTLAGIDCSLFVSVEVRHQNGLVNNFGVLLVDLE